MNNLINLILLLSFVSGSHFAAEFQSDKRIRRLVPPGPPFTCSSVEMDIVVYRSKEEKAGGFGRALFFVLNKVQVKSCNV